MYEQIARNKRRSVVCVLLFFLIWLGVGALVGLVAAQFAQPGTPSPRTADILAGTAVAGLLALAGIAYSLSSGARLVLSVSGAHPSMMPRLPGGRLPMRDPGGLPGRRGWRNTPADATSPR